MALSPRNRIGYAILILAANVSAQPPAAHVVPRSRSCFHPDCVAA